MPRQLLHLRLDRGHVLPLTLLVHDDIASRVTESVLQRVICILQEVLRENLMKQKEDLLNLPGVIATADNIVMNVFFTRTAHRSGVIKKRENSPFHSYFSVHPISVSVVLHVERDAVQTSEPTAIQLRPFADGSSDDLKETMRRYEQANEIEEIFAPIKKKPRRLPSSHITNNEEPERIDHQHSDDQRTHQSNDHDQNDLEDIEEQSPPSPILTRQSKPRTAPSAVISLASSGEVSKYFMTQPEPVIKIEDDGPLTSKIRQETAAIMDELTGIFRGQVRSWRRQAFVTGGKQRDLLKTHISFAGLSDGEAEQVSDMLVEQFCQRGPSNKMTFVLDVLVPEAIIRIVMARENLTYEQAETKMANPRTTQQNQQRLLEQYNTTASLTDDQRTKIREQLENQSLMNRFKDR